MESKAKLFGHAIHPVLIVFPLGLLATAVVFDIVWLLSAVPSFAVVSYWMIVAGLIGGLLAAPFGLIDWFAIPGGTRARTVGLVHGLTMFLTLVLFFASWWLRASYEASSVALTFSFIGAATALAGGWLGGELVERLGVGVDDGANLNAPNSLTTSSARANVPVQDR
ncbi:MAG TPA: DUF2231 domain-containing protein [Pyrinomonadaceae bacterium]